MNRIITNSLGTTKALTAVAAKSTEKWSARTVNNSQLGPGRQATARNLRCPSGHTSGKGEQPKFDRDSVMLCWAPVQALLNDLEEHVEPV